MADGIDPSVFDSPWRNNPLPQQPNWLDMATKQAELQKYSLENAQTIAQQRAFRDYGEAAMRGDQEAISKLGAVGAYSQGSLASQIPGHLATGQGVQWDNQNKAMSQIQQTLRSITDPEQQKAAAQGFIAEAVKTGVMTPSMAAQYSRMVNDPASLNAFIYRNMTAPQYTQATGMDKAAGDRAGQAGIIFQKGFDKPEDILYQDPVTKKYFTKPTPPTQIPGAPSATPPAPGGGYQNPPAPPTTRPAAPAPAGSTPGPSSSTEPAPTGARVIPAAYTTEDGVLPKGAYSARLDPSEGYGQNPMSSAYGRGQFIRSTWLDMLSKTHPEYNDLPEAQRLALRGNTALATEMTEAYAKENAVVLARAGLPVNAATLAMAHKLGPGGAVRTLQADPNTPMPEILGAKAARVNPTWAKQTAQGFINSQYNAMTGMRPEFLGPADTPSAATTVTPVSTTAPAPDLGNKGPQAPPAGPATPPASQAGRPGVTRSPLSPLAGEPSAAATAAGREPATAAPPAAETPPAPATARSTAPFKLAAVVGDSLGQQVNNHAKVEGVTRVGAPTEEVERRVASLPDGYFSGKDVLLSSGTSNAAGDPEKFDRTERIIDDIQTRLGGRVALLGVGARYKDFNVKLQEIAAEKNIPFIAPSGPFTKHDGGVHMQNAAATHQNVINTASSFYSGQGAQPAQVDTLGRPQVTPIPAPPPMSGPAIITEPPPATAGAPAGPGVDTVVKPGATTVAAAGTPASGMIPNPPFPKMTEEEKADYAENIRLGGEQHKEAHALAKGAEAGMMNIPQLEHALHLFQTGSLGEAKLLLSQYFMDIMTTSGFPVSDEMRKYAAAGELVRTAGGNLAFDRINAMGAREAVQVVQQVMAIKPNLLNTPEGNRLIVESIRQEFQRALDRRDYIANLPPGERHKGFVEFNKLNPPDVYSSRVIPKDMPTGVTQQNAPTKLKHNVIYNVKWGDGTVAPAKYDQRNNRWAEPGVNFLPLPPEEPAKK